MTREEAEKLTILRGVVGSTVHGLNVQDGIEDRDEMGVLVEPVEEAMGVGAPFEQFIYRSATERTGNPDARSMAGDLDLVLYSLRKYLRLALKGNPTILTLLFLPGEAIVKTDALGSSLQELAPQIASRRAGGAFLGYLQAQRQRLVGERGQKRTKRPELEEAFGFDTKYAMHMLRLAFQGIEFMQTGRLTLPIAEPSRSWLLGVRKGQVDLQECLTKAGQLEADLRDLLDSSPLPAEPDEKAVEAWMIKTYMNNWKAEWTSRQWREDAEIFGIKRES